MHPFYIIGRNPNTPEEAADFLDAGANGLEPDVFFEAGDKQFLVQETVGPNTNGSTLEDYLSTLKSYIERQGNKSKLALIAFDVKNPDAFNLNTFFKYVNTLFSSTSGVCKGVAVMATVASKDDIGFLTKFNYRFFPGNYGIGVDEDGNPDTVEKLFVQAGQKRIAYADGNLITTPYNSLVDAKRLQSDNGNFKLVYTWVLKSKKSMQQFLDIDINGIIVNSPGGVEDLLDVLNRESNRNRFIVVETGYNPFAANVA